ncbi:MAG: transaldolase [Candidatus Acidiferrales bacterium]
MNKSNSVAHLKRLGQSIWLDQLDRRMIASGELRRLRDAGVSGVTANPTIFAKALEASEAYAGEVKQRLAGGENPEDVIWDLLIEDVQAAADVFRPVHESSGGADGYVSIEVSPEISGSTEQTIQAARDLHRRCARPNVMVKIPATPSGLPAIRTMIGESKNTNVTLIFGIDRYVEVVEAFLAGLGDLRRAGGDLSQVRSVASFFVSRVDTKVDEQLVKKIEQASLPQKQELEALLGRAGVANSKLAYQLFKELHSGGRWESVTQAGASVQRCLWASTSVKNPRYRDTMYVEDLIGPATINTMPPATFGAFRDHGRAAPTLEKDIDQARRDLDRLSAAGIDLRVITQELEDEGVASFAKSFRESVQHLGNVSTRR